MRHPAGLTLVEILVVVTLIGIISLPMYFSYTRAQANQSLRSSTEQLVYTMRNAHVFSREAKDKRAWGVKNIDSKSFALVSGKPTSFEIEKTTQLESLVTFPEDFTVWFEIGTGNALEPKKIKLKNSYEKTSEVEILTTGVIDIVNANP